MNNRIDIRIAILADTYTDIMLFKKMLFLLNDTNITPNEMYMEIDIVNLKGGSKKIIEECKQHNQIDIPDKILYKNIPRIRGLIDYTSKENTINKNVLLTFYFFGINWKKFHAEISSANMFFYIINTAAQSIPASDLFTYVSTLVQESSSKYLLKIINQDNQSQGNNNEENIPQSESLISMSFNYSYLVRQIIYNQSRQNDNVRLNKDDVIANKEKYLKQCGFLNFRNIFLHTLSTNYKSMLDANFESSVRTLDELFIKSPDEFILKLALIINKAGKLTKIFKPTSYLDSIAKALGILLDKYTMDQFDPLILKSIKKICTDPLLVAKIDQMENNYDKNLIQCYTSKLYSNKELFLPTEVFAIFDKLINLSITKNDLATLIKFICDLYSETARTLLIGKSNETMLYNSYFTNTEVKKLVTMLNHIKEMIDFDVYKIHLIQILLTKLMIGEKLIADDMYIGKIIEYNQSLKHYLSDNANKKYDYFVQY
jgi:hypothetical protein